MASLGQVLPVLAAIALGVASGPALAARKPLVNCPAGQFVFENAPLTAGARDAQRAAHAVLLQDGAVSIPGVCPPTQARLRPGRRGMRLSARWSGCDGIAGRVRLQGRTNASCDRLTARLHVSKAAKAGGHKAGKAALDACFLDGGIQPLENGQESYTALPCTGQTDDLLQVLDTVCTTLQGSPCANTSATCGRRARELFTGVSLFPSAAQPASWNRLGGRGELMAHAGLCILKDLAAGGHVNAASADIGIGSVSVEQPVGFLAYDPAERTVRFYHHLDFCVPVFGCVTGVGQTVTVRAVTSCPAHPVGRSCGTYPIRTAHGLDVLTNESSRYVGLAAPVIVVVTPYGPVNVQPSIQFWSKLGAVQSPFGASALQDHSNGPIDARFVDPPGAAFADLHDRYGRMPGVLFSSEPWSIAANVGWDSQLAFGSRDPRAWTSFWTPGPTPMRPDHDLLAARSAGEKEANVRVRAEADISYSPTDLLPSFLTASGVDLSFRIWIKPKADAAVAGQLLLYGSEGFRYQLDNDLDDYTQMVVRDGAAAAGSFVVDAGMDLVATIDLPSPFDDIELVAVHPNLSIPIATREDDSRDGGSWRTARAGSTTDPPDPPAFDGPLRTFHGDVDGAAFVAQCLDQPVPEQPKPEPSFTPGDPNVLKKSILYPCNICVGVGQHDVDLCRPTPGHTPAQCTQGPRCHPALIEAGTCENLSYHSTPQKAVLFPSTSNPLPAAKRWQCDGHHKSGCLDLCAFDPVTKALTVAKSAVDEVGPHCGIPVPK